MAQRIHHRHARLRRACIHATDDEARLIVNRWRQVRGGRHGDRHRHRGHFVGRVGTVLAPAAQYAGSLGYGVEDARERHDRTERVRAELERRDDAEVAAAAANRPEEIRLRRSSSQAHGPVRAHDARREQAVDREAVLAPHPPFAAAEREPRDAGFRHDPAGHHQASALRFAIHIAPEGSALHARHAGVRIHVNAAHAGEVDDHAAIAARVPRDRVAAAAHGHQQLVLPREVHGVHDIGRPRAADEQRRPPRMHGVVYRLVGVPGIGRRQHLTPDRRPESSQRVVVDARAPSAGCGNHRRQSDLLPAVQTHGRILRPQLVSAVPPEHSGEASRTATAAMSQVIRPSIEPASAGATADGRYAR